MEIFAYDWGRNTIPREKAKATILIPRAPKEEVNVIGH